MTRLGNGMRVAGAILAMLAVVLLAGCSSAASSSDPASIVQTQCTRCHPIDRIKLAQHDLAGWQDTVQRMISNHGAQLSDTDAQAVATFLANGGAAKL